MLSVEQLLQDLDGMTHTARVHRMIELGQRSKDDTTLVSLIIELEQRGFYERFLALYTCFTSLDQAHVVRSLTDPSRIIRMVALRLLPLVCDDTQLGNVLEMLPAQLRIPAFWKLHKDHRYEVIDNFIVKKASENDPQFLQLLSFAGPTTILRYASQFIQQATMLDWKHLLRFQPDVVLTLFEQWSSVSLPVDERLISYFNKMIEELANARPERTLEFVTILAKSVPLSRFKLQGFVEKLPVEVANLVLAENYMGSLNFSRVVNRLSTEQIIRLLERQQGLYYGIAQWFPELRPEQRLIIYDVLENRYHYKGGTLLSLVGSLPDSQREQHVRKNLALRQQTPELLMGFAVYLPWDEVLTTLDPFLHSADADIRQNALLALIKAGQYNKNHFFEILALLQTRRTEQDAVRRSILVGLLTLPRSIWQEGHLAALEEIIRHGLNDVGLSLNSLQQIYALLIKLAPVYLNWSISQLLIVIRERGFPALSLSLNHLSATEIHSLAQSILPILSIWMEQEKESAVIDVIRLFTSSRQAFESVLPLLLDILQSTTTGQTAENILELLARHLPEQQQTLIPALLQADRSWITLKQVSRYLVRKRQDLLTPFLRLQAYGGRFSTGRKRFLISFSTELAGATPSQQDQLATSIMEIIRDESQDSHTITSAIKQLAFLPAISSARLAELSQDPRSVVRTTALFTLGRLDSDQGVPILIAALQDARARIAIHSLRPFLLKMPTSQALSILQTVSLTERVTVAKEVIRLIGELSADEAFHEIIRLEQQTFHRDIRVVLLQTLWRYPDRPEIWPVLENAARSSDQTIALASISMNFAPEKSLDTYGKLEIGAEGRTVEQEVLKLHTVLLDHPIKEVRQITLRYCSKLELRDEKHLILPRLLELMQAAPSYQEQSNAASAVFNLCVEEQDTPLIVQAIKNVLHRRALLQSIVQILTTSNYVNSNRYALLVREIMNVLGTDPITVILRLRLAIQYFSTDELAAFFQNLAAKNELHPDALSEACQMLSRGYYRFALPQLETLEAILAASSDERLRRLALVVLVAQAQSAHAWGKERLARLNALRADASTMVAAVAQFTFTNEEEDDDDDDDYDEDGDE